MSPDADSAIASSRIVCQWSASGFRSGNSAGDRYGVRGTRENSSMKLFIGARKFEWSEICRSTPWRTRPRRWTCSMLAATPITSSHLTTIQVDNVIRVPRDAGAPP